jgi:hypothetical protein
VAVSDPGARDGARVVGAGESASCSSRERERGSRAAPDEWLCVLEKLFMSMNASGTPNELRMCSTCFAMKSRKVSSPLSFSSDLAFSRPMPVPRPPFSLSITHCPSSAESSAVSESYEGSFPTGVMDFSGIMRLAPEASFS